MTKKSFVLCFLFLLSNSYCSECTDKTSFTSEEDGYEFCRYLKTSSNEKVCRYDTTKNVCVEKSCSDFDADDCGKMGLINDEEGSNYKSCSPKADNSGCELIYCEDLTSNCDKFIANPIDQCVMNSEKTHCELQKCEDLTSDCQKFVPKDYRYKCALNDEKAQCEIKEKDCEEADPDKCHDFSNSDQRCILDSSSNRCRLIQCDTLSSSECTKFRPYSESQICAPIGDKCEIKTSCSELSEEVCETIKFANPGDKCIYSAENGRCEYSSCYQLESNCGQFVPLDTLYKCTYDKEIGGCELEYKDCEELSKDQCDLFNTEDNLEDTGGKRCIEDNGKCVLASKKLDISLLLFSLLLFLF